MKNWAALAIVFLPVLMALGDDATKLARAKREFEKADTGLNKTYQDVRGELDKTKAAELRERQREWIQHRDNLAGFAPALGLNADDDVKKSPEFWETMTALTKVRAGFLQIYTGKNVTRGISGEYRDSFGGSLQLEVKKNGIAFSVEVVRGPSGANGELSGLARRRGSQAFFKDKPDAGDDREPCEITLTFIDAHIVNLEGRNTTFYHGARAYFDGTYFKSGKLKESIKLDADER